MEEEKVEEWLNTEECLFDRDDKGDLIPRKVEVEGLAGRFVSMIPLTAGQFKRIFSDGKTTTTLDQDEEIVLSAIKKPLFDATTIKSMRKSYRDALVMTVLKNSDIVFKNDGFKKKEPVGTKEQ